SENYIVYNQMNFDPCSINIIPLLYSTSALSYFEGKLLNTGLSRNEFENLDFFLTLQLYISSLPPGDQLVQSTNNILRIQKNVLNIYENQLRNNLNQFVKLLEIINSFTITNRFIPNVNNNFLIYGIFYPTATLTKTSYVSVDET